MKSFSRMMPTMNRDDSGSGGTIQERIEEAITPVEETTEEVTTEKETTEEVATKEASAEEETTEEETTEEEETSEEEAAEEETETDDDSISLEVSDFAEVLGIEEKDIILDEDGAFHLRTNVNGEIGKVNMTELIKSFQTDAHVTQKSQALAEERRTFEDEMSGQRTALQTRFQEAAAVSQLIEAQLKSEYDAIDWDKLRAEDPGRWSAQRQVFQDRVNALTAAKQTAMAAYQTQSQEATARQNQERAVFLEKEAEALRTALPEWNDPAVAAEQHGKMSQFLVDTYGFSNEHINMVEDHRLLLLALDAQKYRASQETSKQTVKKVRKLPKITKPGASTRGRAKAAKADAHNKKLIKLRKGGGRTDDVAAALMDIIN